MNTGLRTQARRVSELVGRAEEIKLLNDLIPSIAAFDVVRHILMARLEAIKAELDGLDTDLTAIEEELRA